MPLVQSDGTVNVYPGDQLQTMIPVVASVGQVGCGVPLSPGTCERRRPPDPLYEPMR